MRIILKVENVSKKYKLGQIGGMTLRDELQRKWARARKKILQDQLAEDIHPGIRYKYRYPGHPCLLRYQKCQTNYDPQLTV